MWTVKETQQHRNFNIHMTVDVLSSSAGLEYFSNSPRCS